MIGSAEDLAAQIRETNNRHEGWCDIVKAETLAAMMVALRPQVVVEIGVFGARSLVALALGLKRVGSGKVIGIDPWKAEISVDGMQDPANLDWWSNLDHEAVYQRCMANLAKSDVMNFVEIIRANSQDIDPTQWKIQTLHVDGSHEETAYHDMVRYGACVVPGGIVIADDTGWVSGAPKRGVEWLLQNGFIELFPLGTGAVFQRVK